MKIALLMTLLLPFSASAATTYTAHAQPILKNRCARCHEYLPEKNWSKYEDAFKHRDAIKTKMLDKTMPPDQDIPQAERDTLIKWVDEGAQK